jgi:hypothetical protein
MEGQVASEGLEWVTRCLAEEAAITAGVPRTAADLLHRASRQDRAKVAVQAGRKQKL